MSDPSAPYVLGSSDQEIERLDRQSASLERPTRLLLQAAGVAPGMRVLDLGTGVGHVATLLAERVGPQGSVVGLDSNERLLQVAGARAAALPQLRFVQGDVRDWRDDEPFDAVVGRLILFHLADPLAVVRYHAAALRAGGLWLALDFDLGASRSVPPVPLVDQALGWVSGAFARAGANPAIGTRLAPLLAQAGLAEVQGFGVQGYSAGDDPRGPALLTAVVRSLVPQIVACGLATPAQIGIDTLEQRLREAIVAAGAVVVLPTLVGAWGRRR